MSSAQMSPEQDAGVYAMSKPNVRGKRKKNSRLPVLAQAGPVSIWMVLFVTLPLLFIIYVSFMIWENFIIILWHYLVKKV